MHTYIYNSAHKKILLKIIFVLSYTERISTDDQTKKENAWFPMRLLVSV